ncbi:hypothetical protein V6575_07715 [Roseibium sp. H3510]|uniref:PepSY domain-containing protein n=1 Tax=Roseibium algae TaxID=3123038 RepID=A0ABU8TJR1_9HYPH
MKRSFAICLFAALSVSTASAQCLSQGEARQAVASGKAASLGSMKGAAGGEIVKAQLCIEGGRYVYRLSVLVGGQVQTKVLNASR